MKCVLHSTALYCTAVLSATNPTTTLLTDSGVYVSVTYTHHVPTTGPSIVKRVTYCSIIDNQ